MNKLKYEQIHYKFMIVMKYSLPAYMILESIFVHV